MTGPHIVQDDADEHVEGDAEEVDDGGAHLLRDVLAAHLHHAGPEEADRKLKDAEGDQLQLPLEGDACSSQTKHSASDCLRPKL